MDSLQACQFIHNFIGKSSSSITELFELLSALVPAGDLLSTPKLAPEQAIVSTSTIQSDEASSSSIVAAFPVMISKDALTSLLDISFIEIQIGLSIYYHHWLKRVLLACLSQRVTGLYKGSPTDRPPLTFKFNFRFVEKFNIRCSHVSIMTTEEPTSILNPVSLVASCLQIKPLFTLAWSIRQRDSKDVVGATNALVTVQNQIPRLVNFIIALLRRLYRLSQSLNRSALTYTARILAHIDHRISTLENGLNYNSEAQNRTVSELRLKLKAFYKTDESIFQAGIKNLAGMVQGATTNLSEIVESTKKLALIPPGVHSLPQIALPAGISTPHAGMVEIASTSDIQEVQPQQTNLTVFKSKLPDILQAFMLALITELYFFVLKLPICLDSIINPVIGTALTHLSPHAVHNATFCLSGPKLPENSGDIKSTVPLNLPLPMKLPPTNLPSIDSVASMVKPPSPPDLKTILSNGGAPTDSLSPIGKPFPAIGGSIPLPRAVRNVSWGTCSPDSESDPKDIEQIVSPIDVKNRKVLPKSPKPKNQISMSLKNAALVTKPIIEPIQLCGSGEKEHPFPLKRMDEIRNPLSLVDLKKKDEENHEN